MDNMSPVTTSRKLTQHFRKKVILTFKHGGGCVMAWEWFVVSGLELLVVIESTMNFALYQKIMKLTSVMQQNNGPLDDSKNTYLCLNSLSRLYK